MQRLERLRLVGRCPERLVHPFNLSDAIAAAPSCCISLVTRNRAKILGTNLLDCQNLSQIRESSLTFGSRRNEFLDAASPECTTRRAARDRPGNVDLNGQRLGGLLKCGHALVEVGVVGERPVRYQSERAILSKEPPRTVRRPVKGGEALIWQIQGGRRRRALCGQEGISMSWCPTSQRTIAHNILPFRKADREPATSSRPYAGPVLVSDARMLRALLFETIP